MRLFYFGLTALLCTLRMSAAPNSTLPGCEANPEIGRTISARLTGRDFDNLPFDQQKTLQRQVLSDLAAQYPRDVEPQRELIHSSYSVDQDYYLGLMSRYRQLAEAHPDDPLMLYFAGQVLGSPDPDASLNYLKRAKQLAPNFPWPDLEMTFTYSGGRTVDKVLAREHIDRFFAICPESEDWAAQYLLSRFGSLETRKKAAAALRKRLEGETDPSRVLAFDHLWSLEFQTHPVPEHDAVRKQVAADVARLETIEKQQPKPDGALLHVILNGYKQSGADQQVITATEDRIIKASDGPEAIRILHERWSTAHPEPENPNDKVAWEKHNAESLTHQRDLMRLFPNDTETQHETLFREFQRQIAPDEAQFVAAFDDHIHYEMVYRRLRSDDYLDAADFLLEHNLQPQRALQYAQKASQVAAHERALENQIDRNMTEASLKDREDYRLEQQQEITGAILRAAVQSHLQAVQVSSVAPDPPAEAKLQSGYWADRARQAVLDNHSTDALAFYQKALLTRTNQPRMYHGRKIDPLGDEARGFWMRSGGTDSAYAIWSAAPNAKGTELALGTWEKPTKAMPSFQLTDLNGKIWSLKGLEGKAVLINVWATWCGFCMQELPKLEKLYQEVKDRPDVQILTFNIDEDAGLAAPFIKEHSYTFPVLLASDTVNQILDSIGIPQNWIVSRAGQWQWTQMGFDSSDSNWQTEMLTKLKTD